MFTELIGTSLADSVTDVAVDSEDRVYLTGTVDASLDGLPHFGLGDAFARRYGANRTVDWTYFRGNALDNRPRDIAVSSATAIIIGQDRSDTGDLDDAFYRAVDIDGDFNAIDVGGILGTPVDDDGTVVVVDDAQNVYLMGESTGDFVGGANPAGLQRGFIARYNPTLTTEVWREGIVDDDDITLYGAVVVSGGIVVVAGDNQASRNVVATKFSFDGTILWSTVHGSDGTDRPSNIIEDVDGSLLIVGETNGDWGEPNNGADDIFVLRLTAGGQFVEVGLIGTAATERGEDLVVDDGQIIIVGTTFGDLGAPNNGSGDAVLIEVAEIGASPRVHQFGTAANDLFFEIDRTSTGFVVVGNTGANFGGRPNAGDSDGMVNWVTLR